MSHPLKSVAVLALLLIGLLLGQQKLLAQSTTASIRVGINPVEPFVILDGETPRGFSIDLWTALAAEAQLPFEFVPLENVGALLDAVEAESIDLGIGATSITADREQVVDFSQPFFTSGLQIMTGPDANAGLLATLRSVFTQNVLILLAISFLTLLIIAHIAWLIERKENVAFQGSYLHGIWTAFYWTVTTATTVGYGDTVLRDNRGKLLALAWMLLSLFLVSYFTATITTSLTVGRLDSGISGPDDLRRYRVVTLPDTTSASYLRARGIRFSNADDLGSAVALLQDGQADALVYDAPVLQYFATLTAAEDVRLVPDVFQAETYGIVMPQDSPLREPVNQALLRLYENGSYEQLRLRWFGESP